MSLNNVLNYFTLSIKELNNLIKETEELLIAHDIDLPTEYKTINNTTECETINDTLDYVIKKIDNEIQEMQYDIFKFSLDLPFDPNINSVTDNSRIDKYLNNIYGWLEDQKNKNV